LEKLLNPDTGLMIWTVLTFAVLVFVLGRFAWKPLLESLAAREDRIRADVKAAEEARLAAEKMRNDYQDQLAAVEGKTRELIARAQAEADRLREDMVKTAQGESVKLMEKTRRQMEEEQRRLVRELRTEVADLSVAAAEKLLRQAVDKSVKEKFVRQALSDFDKMSKDIH